MNKIITKVMFNSHDVDGKQTNQTRTNKKYAEKPNIKMLNTEFRSEASKSNHGTYIFYFRTA